MEFGIDGRLFFGYNSRLISFGKKLTDDMISAQLYIMPGYRERRPA